uniref:t-SNARE coiled-coil homology domain-containing protein n=1 Tax=Syphacia muris TaxID=451379 RepID=A0A0N5AE48_9BILA
MSRKNNERRDTVKDIILGLDPSGSGPREPRGGYAKHTPTSRNSERRIQPIIVEGTDTSAINRLQDRLHSLQRQQNELLSAETQARRKLEKDYEDLKRKVRSNDLTREIDGLKRQLGNLESKVNSLSQDVSMTKLVTDRLTKSDSQRSDELNRYSENHNRVSSQLNELSEQLNRLKKSLDEEIEERNAATRSYADNMKSIRDDILQDLNNKTSGIVNRSVKDRDLEELRTETMLLNEKLQRRLNDVEKRLNANETKVKENVRHERRNSVESGMKQQLKAQQEDFEKLESKTKNDLKECLKELHQLKIVVEEEKQASDERVKALEKNLAGLKKRLKSENDKINSVLTADINSRKLHENGMLAKMDFMEEQLKAHFNSVTKSMENNSKKAHPEQTFDYDSVNYLFAKICVILVWRMIRREMESIAADKNKLSIEGLLKLEEKMRKINQDTNRFNNVLRKKINKLSENENGVRMKQELDKLIELQREFEESQRYLADKIEHQIPQNLNELSAKTNHIKQQLNERIDRVEEDNANTLKELHEVKTASRNNSAGNTATEKPISKGACENTIDFKLQPLEEDFEKYKIAVKKLAESLTTVKNVLEKRIENELRKPANSKPFGSSGSSGQVRLSESSGQVGLSAPSGQVGPQPRPTATNNKVQVLNPIT